MKKTNWLTFTIIGIIALVVLFWLGTWVGGGYRGSGMMGGYSGHMGWGYTPFGRIGMGLGMLVMWFIPIGIVVLLVYGIVALARNTGNNPPPATLPPCPNCGRGTQADWQNCPYCGTALK